MLQPRHSIQLQTPCKGRAVTTVLEKRQRRSIAARSLYVWGTGGHGIADVLVLICWRATHANTHITQNFCLNSSPMTKTAGFHIKGPGLHWPPPSPLPFPESRPHPPTPPCCVPRQHAPESVRLAHASSSAPPAGARTPCDAATIQHNAAARTPRCSDGAGPGAPAAASIATLEASGRAANGRMVSIIASAAAPQSGGVRHCSQWSHKNACSDSRGTQPTQSTAAPAAQEGLCKRVLATRFTRCW